MDEVRIDTYPTPSVLLLRLPLLLKVLAGVVSLLGLCSGVGASIQFGALAGVAVVALLCCASLLIWAVAELVDLVLDMAAQQNELARLLARREARK